MGDFLWFADSFDYHPNPGIKWDYASGYVGNIGNAKRSGTQGCRLMPGGYLGQIVMDSETEAYGNQFPYVIPQYPAAFTVGFAVRMSSSNFNFPVVLYDMFHSLGFYGQFSVVGPSLFRVVRSGWGQETYEISANINWTDWNYFEFQTDITQIPEDTDPGEFTFIFRGIWLNNTLIYTDTPPFILDVTNPHFASQFVIRSIASGNGHMDIDDAYILIRNVLFQAPNLNHLGPVQIVPLLITGAGDQGEWTSFPAGQPNWQQVDDVSGHDNESTYIEATTIPGLRSNYTLQSPIIADAIGVYHNVVVKNQTGSPEPIIGTGGVGVFNDMAAVVTPERHAAMKQLFGLGHAQSTPFSTSLLVGRKWGVRSA